MRYAIKPVGLAVFLVVLFCVGARAQEQIKPEKRALIKELYLATRADKLAETFTNITLTQMERDLPRMLSELPEMADLKSRERDQAQKTIAETSTRMLRRFKELMPERINFAEVMEQMFYPIYDRFFSEDELKDLVAFYKSPTGRKSIEVMPQLMQDAVQRSNQALNAKVMDLVMEVIQEEKKNMNRAGAKR